MPILSLDLPVPSANAAGAAVDCTAMGPVRQVVVGGTYTGVIHVEVTNEAVPTAAGWVSVGSFPTGGGKLSINLAARFMRARMAAYAGGAGNCDVSGWDSGVEFGVLAVPAGDGVGASLDTSALDTFRSVVVGGAFTGNVIIEVSDDNVSFVPIATFTSQRGVFSDVIPDSRMRVRRTGGSSGTPIVVVGAGSLTGSEFCGFVATAVPFADAGGCLIDDVTGMFYTDGENRLSVDNLSILQLAQTGGTPTAGLFFNGANHLDLANAEATDVVFGLSRVVNFVGGGSAFSQRAMSIGEPTYSADAAQTLDVAASLAIQGAPVAGANVTITESYALWCGYGINGRGMARFDRAAIGAVATDAALGVLLHNPTPALLGAQQFSPMLVLEGQGFATTPALSQEAQFWLQVRPVQGAALISAELRFFSNVAESSAELARLDSATGADETPLWLFQGSVAAMRRVTMGADNALPGLGFRGLRVPTA